MYRLKMKPIAILLSALLGSCVISTAMAAEDEDSDRKTKQTVAMSQQVYEKLTEIQELVEAKDYASAQIAIDELKLRKGLSDYEKAQVWNLSGYSYYLQERYGDAIRAYEQVLAQPDLPEALQLSTLKTMAQLQFTQEDYEAALVTVRRLMTAVAEPAADVYMLEGQALFQLARYDEALAPIKTAVEMFEAQGQVPKENWLLLLRVIYFEQKNYDAMIDVVKKLIAHYPKDTYVLTLAGVYSELGNTKKQLALTEVLYEKGYLNSASHVTNLANLYLLHGLPYKAAQVLEREMASDVVESNERNLRLLSQAWYQAREDEKAIPPLQQAAKLSEDGELYIRLAQAHINLENWGEAAAAAQKGLQMGGLKRDDTANIMLGMALFNQKRLEQARQAFAKAARDNRSKRAAEQWMAYVDSELRRQELMDQDLPEFQPRDVDDMLNALPPQG
ncbi:MAG: tetratricopeptide repeat protein [Xanthomonadales bacterium]|nr:tetratricopeptide repeat protein [Xanthomonadales bacterium]